MKPGDIIAFSGANLTSDFLNVVTYGVPRFSISHVGILADYGINELRSTLLFESTTLNSTPCVIRGVPTRGAQAQLLSTRLRDYKGKIWHYPLRVPLTKGQSNALTNYLVGMLGTPYGEIEAVRSGGIAWSWIENRLHGPANYAAIFCSEWVAAAQNKIGLFETDNPGKWNPNRLVRRERRICLLDDPRRLK